MKLILKPKCLILEGSATAPTDSTNIYRMHLSGEIKNNVLGKTSVYPSSIPPWPALRVTRVGGGGGSLFQLSESDSRVHFIAGLYAFVCSFYICPPKVSERRRMQLNQSHKKIKKWADAAVLGAAFN